MAKPAARILCVGNSCLLTTTPFLHTHNTVVEFGLQKMPTPINRTEEFPPWTTNYMLDSIFHTYITTTLFLRAHNTVVDCRSDDSDERQLQ